MNLDSFTRHIGAATIALLAVLFSAAVVWQVIHGHEVDALLAGLVGTTIGYLLPSPVQTNLTKPSRDSGYGLIELLVAVLVVIVIFIVLLKLINHL